MVILYNPSSSAHRKPVLPMSLLALGAVLEGEDEYRILDGNLTPDPLQALDQVIRETQANVLAITVMPGPQLNETVPLCRQLRRLHPHLTIVWGGYFPTQHYDVCLRSGLVDFVVLGHGELVFRDLVAHLRRGSDPRELPGVAFPGVDADEVISNEMAPLPDPNFLPDFPYHRVDLDRYVRDTFMGRTLSHHSSYGCPFFCNFCAVVNLVNGRWRAQSARRTAGIVANWLKGAASMRSNSSTITFLWIRAGLWSSANASSRSAYDGGGGPHRYSAEVFRAQLESHGRKRFGHGVSGCGVRIR